MTYELALKLKEAGFPLIEFKGDRFAPADIYVPKAFEIDGKWWIEPTLSELIKEVAMKAKKPFKIYCYLPGDMYGVAFEGEYPLGPWSTPEESVANLWLALNTK